MENNNNNSKMNEKVGIDYEQYSQVIESIRPTVDYFYEAVEQMPKETKVEEIVASLFVMALYIIQAADQEAAEDFVSFDEWFSIVMYSLADGLKDKTE